MENMTKLKMTQPIGSNRVIEVDYLKTFAMLLVVWGHFLECFYSSYANFVYQIIYMFHIPLLVFLSGYLSKFKVKDFVKFITIYLVFFLLYSVFTYIINGSWPSLNFFYPYWLLWYLMSLLIWKACLPILDRVHEKYRAITIVGLFLLGIYLGSHGAVNRFFSLGRTIAFLPFFALGYYNRGTGRIGFNLPIKNIFKIILVFACLIIFGFVTKLIVFDNAAFYMADPYSGTNHSVLQRLLIYIFAFLMIVLLSSIKITKKNKLVEYISKNTLTIFLLHGFIIILFKKYGFLSSRNLSILITLVLSIVTVLLLTLVGVLFGIVKNKLVSRKVGNNQIKEVEF